MPDDSPHPDNSSRTDANALETPLEATPKPPRGYVPVPGVIDLDSVEADTRDALWGQAERTPSPDTDDDSPLRDDLPDASEAPPARQAPSPGAPESDAVDSETPEPEAIETVGTEATDTGETPPPDAPAPEPTTSVLPRPSKAVVQTAKAATKDRGRELVALVTTYGKRHLPETPPREKAPDTGPPRLVGRIGQVLPFMRLIPWVLSLAFAASFVWDFQGLAVTLLGRTIPLEGLLRILSISGLIGFLTNWLAITMLFQPREKRAIIPQGLIPAQRERVIYRLSDAISRELINADIIKQKIQESGVIGRYRDLGLGLVRGVVEDPEFRSDLKALAQRYAQETLGSEEVRRELAQIAVDRVETTAGQGLGGMALRLYRTFAEDDFQRRVDNALAELPQAVTPLLDRIDAALDAVPEKVEARADEIEEAATKAVLSFVEGFDIQAMIQEKARGFDEAQLEHLLKSTSNEQLNYIKYLGGILGVFGGLVIWRVEILAVFVALGLALWALDEVIVRTRRAR